MPHPCQTAVDAVSSTIRTLNPKLSSDAFYLDTHFAGDPPHNLLPAPLSFPSQHRQKPKSHYSRHLKILNRLSSTPPILDRFSPYRHRSCIRSPVPCQKRARKAVIQRHDSRMTRVAGGSGTPASQPPSGSGNSWPLSQRPQTPSRNPRRSQTTADGTAGPTCAHNSGEPSIHSASRPLDGYSRRSYHLDVVQHPIRTAEFGAASLSRLPLAPPIVVQLVIRDHAGRAVNPDIELPFLIAHLSLFTGDGSTPLDMGSAPGGHAPPRRLLYGNIVSSPQKLRDLQGRQGLFFLFPDVSIRWCGQFQLGITLLRISGIDASGAMTIAEHGTILAQTRTRSFDVLSYENYVAPAPTSLTQCFLRQGARIHSYTTTSP